MTELMSQKKPPEQRPVIALSRREMIARGAQAMYETDRRRFGELGHPPWTDLSEARRSRYYELSLALWSNAAQLPAREMLVAATIMHGCTTALPAEQSAFAMLRAALASACTGTVTELFTIP